MEAKVSRSAGNTKKIPFIEVSGDPDRMGFELGSKCKESIRQLVQEVHAIAAAYSPILASREQFLKLTKPFFLAAEAFAPDLMDEIRGIASGAGVAIDEVFALNAIKEISFGAKHLMGSIGCSSFVVGKEVTRDRTVIMGQNQDLWKPFTRHMILLSMRPSKGPAIVTTTLPGLIVFGSQNSDGLGLLVNGLVSKDERFGVPTVFLERKVMQQRKLGDAISVLLETPRATSLNYVIVDKYGEGYDVELAGTDQDVFYIGSGIFTHSNHYLSPKLQQVQDISWIPDSLLRVNRFKTVFTERLGNIGLDHAMQAVKDHHNYPKSLCRHVDDADQPQDQWETSASIIMQPEQLKVWACQGNPCTGEFVEYER